MSKDSNRSGAGDGRRKGAARRVYPLDGAPPRVGRVAANVPPAERVDAADGGAARASGKRGRNGFENSLESFRTSAAKQGGYVRQGAGSRSEYAADGKEAPGRGRAGGYAPSAKQGGYVRQSAGSRGEYVGADGKEAPGRGRAGGYAQPAKQGGYVRQGAGSRSEYVAGGPLAREERPPRGGFREPLSEDGFSAEIADPKKRNALRGVRRARPEAEPLPEDGHLLCGRNPIREALRAGRPVEKLLVASGDLSGAAQEIVQLAREAGAVVQRVDRTRLDQIYSAHQGMIAYVAAVAYSTVDEMLERAAQRGEEPLLVLLDGITDPHNLGAIVRTAECVGAHGVILPERRSAGLTPAAAKAAAGALNYMPIARVKNLNRTIDELKARGVWIVGASMNGESAFSADLSGPTALVIGSEGDGVSRLTLEKCDRRVALPMKGHLDSLNASVAAGVLLYAIARARA